MIHSRLALAFRGPNLDLESSRGGLFGLAFLDESSPLQMEPEQRAGKAKPHLVSQVRPCWLLAHRPPLSQPLPCVPHSWQQRVDTLRGGASFNQSHRQQVLKMHAANSQEILRPPCSQRDHCTFSLATIKTNKQKVHFVLMPQSSLCCHI